MAATNPPGLETRLIALDIWRQVLHKNTPLDMALEKSEKLQNLSAPDRGFARLILATGLRRLGQIDAVIEKCLERGLPQNAEMAKDILRISIAQLLFLETPPHAAVHLGVELCARKKMPGLKGLVNAVLRRVQNEGKNWILQQNAGKINTPEWLYALWSQSYGEDVARAIGNAHLSEPPLDITVKADAELWAERLGANILPGGSLRVKTGGQIAHKEGFDEGGWWVQDFAASLPVKLFGNVSGKAAIDLCAAPGGKTAQLAALGAKVTALDISEPRLKRLEENLGRLGLSAEIVKADAGQWNTDKKFDFVLLDAPCTATGTIRRHPDIAWLKRPDDVEKTSAMQTRLLTRAAEFLRPSGILVYAVCSLQAQEGEDVIEKFLKQNPHFARVPVKADEIGGFAELLTPKGDLRTLPCDLSDIGGMDGFYAARLQAKE